MGYGKAGGTGIMPTRAAVRTPRHGRNSMLRHRAWLRTGACIRRPLEITEDSPHISEFVHFVVKIMKNRY